MTFQLEQVVPWGRSFPEYVSMFSLADESLRGRILGCGDGPAGFNAELTRRGGSVVSVDPLYEFNAEQIRARIDNTFDTVLEQTRANAEEFVWKHVQSVDQLGSVRMKAMNDFLRDYPRGLEEGRYVAGSLPSLDLPDSSFDLALCSHFLFLYSQHFDLTFHIDSISELCRVSNEVRIFPILQLGSKRSPYVDPVRQYFCARGYDVGVEKVSYEFQRGGNEMLRIRPTDPKKL